MASADDDALTTPLRLPLSLSQREVWWDQRAWPASAHLNLGGTAFFEGALDLPRLRRALTLLVAENAALRLVLHDDGSQSLLPPYEPDLPIIDFAGVDDPQTAMRIWWHDWMRRPFDLAAGPPWRFALLRAHDELHGGTIQFHHLIMDGWGTTQVMKRWSALYNQLVDGVSVQVTDDRSYLKFIEESNHYRQSDAFTRDAAYWRAQLPLLPEPLIARRAGTPREAGLPVAQMAVQMVPRADYDRLIERATGLGVTPFNYFLAAVALYFARVTGRDKVLVGVPCLNRSGHRYRDTMGMFVGVMAVHVGVAPDMRASELVSEVGALMRAALRHARYPLSALASDLEVVRSGRDGLFDVLLSFERQEYAVAFGSARLTDYRQLFAGIARYPLGITVCEFHPGQDLELTLEGSAACYAGHEVGPLAARIWHIVQQLARAPDAAVQHLPIIAPEEQANIVHLRHDAVLQHAHPPTYVSAFERHAALTPQATALVWDGGSMDYHTLDQRANQLAHRLVASQAGRDRVVAVAMLRSPDLVIAMLAIAKAGAAYLPLDPDAPLARLATVLADSAAVALLIQEENWERLAPLHTSTVLVRWQQTPASASAATPPAIAAPQDLAYVLFTSGSTGRPKGVMVEHAALSRRLAWLTRVYGVSPQDRAGQTTQATFDPSLIELCLPLVNGASIALAPPGRLRPEQVADFAIHHRVTIMAFVPSTLTGFLNAVAGRDGLVLRVACCGGEVLPPELARRYLDTTGARLFNVYGPTEACIFATAWSCAAGDDALVLPIGLPVDDTRIYVLDALRQPVPDGVTGEIHIGGDALARGYLGQPETTAAAFVGDPFRIGSRMYRTGDSGWLDHQGNLHFLGRRDRQVKLRGYRIELGEIEAGLLAIEGVTQAAAKLLTTTDGQPAIHGWAVRSGTCDTTADDLLRMLRVRLPDYMVPAALHLRAEMPLGSAGKIDYDALHPDVVTAVATAARAPANTLERELLQLWQQVLERPTVTVMDNFFDVGGDSLAAISILTGAERLLGRRIPLYLLTENPTVERLAQAMQLQTAEPGLMVHLGEGVAEVPLFFAASGHGDLMRFRNLAAELVGSCDLRMMQPPAHEAFERITDLAKLYADRIQALGGVPGFVAGFSIGGIAALETARLLSERGVAVRGLILIDTVYPKIVWGGTFYWRVFAWLVRHLHIQELSINGRRLGAMVNDPGLVGQVMAMAGYRIRAFDGPTVLIKTSGLSRWDRMLFGSWNKLLRDSLSVRRITGLHGSIFETGKVHELAVMLADIVRGRDHGRP